MDTQNVDKYVEALELVTTGLKVKQMFQAGNTPKLVKLSKNIYWGSIGSMKSENIEQLGIRHIIQLSTAGFNIPDMPHTLVSYTNEESPVCNQEQFDKIYEVYMKYKADNKCIAVVDLVGTNKSACLCTALLMKDNRWKLADTVEYMVTKCGFILQQKMYQADLVQFAHREKLLDDEHRLRQIHDEEYDMSYFDGLLEETPIGNSVVGSFAGSVAGSNAPPDLLV